MIELFTAKTTNGQRAAIALLESGLPHKIHVVDFKKKSKAFLKANPQGRVPALADTAADGKAITVTQSWAIMNYVADKSGRFMPTTPRERACCQEWLALFATDLAPAFNMAYRIGTIAQDGDGKAKKMFQDRALGYFKQMDGALARSKYLAGDDITLADMAVYPSVVHGLSDFPGVAKLKNLQRWAKTMGARPAVKKAMAIGA
ncbi:MAG: glutathione S-transferase family protein [Alphaproteobacteria bacterium]